MVANGKLFVFLWLRAGVPIATTKLKPDEFSFLSLCRLTGRVCWHHLLKLFHNFFLFFFHLHLQLDYLWQRGRKTLKIEGYCEEGKIRWATRVPTMFSAKLKLCISRGAVAISFPYYYNLLILPFLRQMGLLTFAHKMLQCDELSYVLLVCTSKLLGGSSGNEYLAAKMVVAVAAKSNISFRGGCRTLYLLQIQATVYLDNGNLS